MTQRLTDEELAALERVHAECVDCGDDTGSDECRELRMMLFLKCAKLLAEVREARAFRASVEGYRERLAAEMRASAHRLAFFRYDTHARVIADLSAYAAQGEYDEAVFGEPAEGGAR